MEDIQTPEQTAALTQSVAQDAMTMWSDEKKKEYVALFHERAHASIAILIRTAELLNEGAIRRFIVSQRSSVEHDLSSVHHYRNVSKRSYEEIEAVAKKRAEDIFNELPQVRRALDVVNPDVAKKMDRRDAIVKRGTEKLKELEEASKEIQLSELPPKMTIEKFLEYANDREKERTALVKELNKLGEEGAQLEADIHKALYKGVDGLREAVDLAIEAQIARAKGMQQVQRRVEEKVLFGDSVAAQELLNHFKDDEVSLQDDVKTQMQEILAKALGGTKKQLGGRKK